MTVAELIERLQALPPSDVVLLETHYEESEPSPLNGMLTGAGEVVLSDEEPG